MTPKHAVPHGTVTAEVYIEGDFAPIMYDFFVARDGLIMKVIPYADPAADILQVVLEGPYPPTGAQQGAVLMEFVVARRCRLMPFFTDPQ